MRSVKVFYDACVLYPAPLRDLLMHLAVSGLFQAKWTEHVHEEWMKSLLRNRPDLSRERLERTRRLMDAKAREPLITGYEELIPTLELPDADDRHVLAAAIQGNVSIIVTNNLADFPKEALQPYEIEAMSVDDFVMRLVSHSASKILAVIREQRESLRKPPKSVSEYIEIMSRQGLRRLVEFLKEHQNEI